MSRVENQYDSTKRRERKAKRAVTGRAAARRGARIGEVPITFVERRVGESKLSGRVLMESILMPWRLVGAPRQSRARLLVLR